MRTSREKLLRFRARLDQSLFPPAPAGGSGLGRWEYLLIVVALLALGVVLQLCRIDLYAALNSIWAEDGPVFLGGALAHGFFDSVTTPYADYLVVVPRLIGEAATVVPLRDAAAAISILSALVVALSGLVVWHASAGHIRNPYLRGALALVAVLVPVSNLESLDSAAYVSWYMLFASFWVLLWRPRTWWGTSLGALFVLLAALSNPGVWFFAPLAALRALAIRGWRDLTIVAAYGAGAAAQLAAVLSNSEETTEPVWTSDIGTAYLQRVLDGGAFGTHLGGIFWENLGWPFLIVLTVAALAGLVLGARRADATGRYLAAIAIFTSLAIFVASAYQRAVGTALMWPEGSFSGVASRYVIVPALLLISVAVVLIDRSGRDGGGRGRRLSWAGIAAVALIVVAVVTSFDASDLATRGTPPWDDSVRAARPACVETAAIEVPIPTSPPGYGVYAPCDRVLGR